MKKRPPADNQDSNQDYIYLQLWLPMAVVQSWAYGQCRYITADMIEQCEAVKERHQSQA